jgi:gliding motility-associated-like protein
VNTFSKILFLKFLILGLSTPVLNAQLGFCNGNSGDPIFTENFEIGNVPGPALAPGITTYNFTTGAPNDGDYTISNRTNFFDWHNVQDHTPNDIDGKSLIVNADFTAGEFYRRTVSGLCENTSYEFSAWLINLLPTTACGGAGIPINVRFQIWDATDTSLLASGDTGQIPNRATPLWERYGLVFQTVSNQTSVILKMLNNEVGGCGNDLAIDDIVFRTCGDFIEINDSQNANNIEACAVNGAVSTILTATPDFSIYSSHAYQWQESLDGINWTDIFGETNQTYNTPSLTSTTYYRVKVAEDAINLANPLCSSVSEIFDILIIAQPSNPVSDGDVEACINDPKLITVTVPAAILVDWYGTPIGSARLQENSTSYIPTTAGTYYAEARSVLGNCPSSGRTAVNIQFIDLPVVTDEELTFCKNQTIELSANLQNVTYLWNTGEITENINVSTEGIYTVKVTNSANCSSTKTIELKQINAPVITEVNSVNYDIIVNLENEIGDFEYSIDSFNFQESPIFLGIEVYPSYEITIYDRYGKLLKSFANSSIGWDGTFNNKHLPASDYWYVIQLNDTIYKGHFTLKR